MSHAVHTALQVLIALFSLTILIWPDVEAKDSNYDGILWRRDLRWRHVLSFALRLAEVEPDDREWNQSMGR
jgi:hypothetical protein